MELFDRRAVLRVDTIEIDALRFTFAIERTLRATPNKAEIHVFNLNEDHRRQLAGLREVSCELKVGYRDALHTIFLGDLRSATSKYQPPDWDTKVEGRDGGNARRTSRIHRSYRPGTQLETVFRDIANALGLGDGNLGEIVGSSILTEAGRDFIGGTVLSGQPAAELDSLCATCGLEYSIQGGTLQLLPLGSGLQGTALELSADSGLVGDVEQDTRTGGIKFKSLLIPELRPGRLVEPRTRTVRGGQYRVTKATYKGDTDGQEWYAECEASPPRRRT